MEFATWGAGEKADALATAVAASNWSFFVFDQGVSETVWGPACQRCLPRLVC